MFQTYVHHLHFSDVQYSYSEFIQLFNSTGLSCAEYEYCGKGVILKLKWLCMVWVDKFLLTCVCLWRREVSDILFSSSVISVSKSQKTLVGCWIFWLVGYCCFGRFCLSFCSCWLIGLVCFFH